MNLQWAQKEHAPQSFQVYSDGSVVAPKQNQSGISLSDHIAYGDVKTQELSPGLFLTQSKMQFKKAASFQERYPERKVLQLSFCMEGICEWDYNRQDKYTVSPTECSLQTGVLSQCNSCYREGQTYRVASISLDQKRHDFFMEYLESVHLTGANGSICTKVFTSSTRTRFVLQQLFDTPTDPRLRKLYLEGKTLELLSVFCSEAIGKSRDDLSISKEDYRCILQARDLIDHQFLHPLTIARIAEKSFLSETKLKQGFKICFGCTIYDYIVEKRMEMAYKLLQDGKYKIKDVVWMVGYSNPSHFAESFRKRYGVNPSEM